MSPTPPSTFSSAPPESPAQLAKQQPAAIQTNGQPDGTRSRAEADRKRAYRAQQKEEQKARKENRKAFALETGLDPALLPRAIAGELDLSKNGKVRPKGFEPREWVEVPRPDGTTACAEGKKVLILSWNMLAQALVRRELFPGSDFLKGKDRLPALMEEVLYYAPDIAVLQEVDRLSEHLPSLTLAYGYSSFVGYRQKSHGLLIAHRSTVFEKVGERGIRLDDLPIDDSQPLSETAPESGTQTPVLTEDGSIEEGAEEPKAEEKLTEKEKEIRARPPDAASSTGKASRQAAGLSRTTRNVALFVALAFKDDPSRGIIIGTSHTFWHPSHIYERVRQTALIARELAKFRKEGGEGKWRDWPLFLAGDLNTQPREMTYRLLTGAPLTDDLLADFERSRVIHHSVDKLYDPSYEPPAPPELEAKEGENVASDDLSQHPDRVIKNTREATPEDGLATLEHLQAMFRQAGASVVRSAYGEAYGLVETERSKWYCDRKPEVQMGNGRKVQEEEAEKAKRQRGSWDERVRRGDFEPKYTNFTPLWRCTLDYIFLFPPLPESPLSPAPQWRSLLSMHDFEQRCEPGLPRKGIEPSDHVAVGAVVELF
ncbi:endonuclease [Rhodotorula toruloides]|uniref:Endonuclease n=1 Tax=Rhodotorula toruloides TaxID=5286 RepID=A0A511K6P7_RHOTO|nr:endonuclease [Rhodotorula toruloides]